MYVFRTKKDFPHTIQILGVGTLQAHGNNVIPVDQAAPYMTELNKKDKNNQLVVDEQGGTTPLEGKDLNAAARDWAETIDGLECVDQKQETIDKINEESGALPELTADDALKAAQEYHERAYGNLPDPVNTDQDTLTHGLVHDEEDAGRVLAQKAEEG